jgi:hypothetical protein
MKASRISFCQVFIFSSAFIVLLPSCTQEAGIENDTMTEIISHVQALSSDTMEGRETGKPGEEKASAWIDSVFASQGLKAFGEEGSYQSFQYKPHQPMQMHGHGDSSSLGMALVQEIKGKNVLYALPQQNKRWGIVGAHYDHLGYGDENSLFRGESEIHNGADDNASGVAGMLALSKSLKQSKGDKSMLFAAFSGEEKGLWGSNQFCKSPTIPLDSVDYMINFDMIGRLRGDTLAVYGTGTSPRWMQLLEECNEEGFVFIPSESGVGPSDHTSFYLEDIPVLHFFTGQHPDYHKPSDTSEKINYRGIFRIVNFVDRLIRRLDYEEEWDFTATKDQDEDSTPSFKVTLGVIPDYLYSGLGMRIDGVSDDRPASIAGMRRGDVVVQIDTLIVTDMMSYMTALSMFEPGVESEVTIERNGQREQKTVIWD